MQFLEYFQAEPVLWNTNLKDYKNKLKNHDTWMLMELPIEELKSKKKSLLASYRAYRNKVKKCEKSKASSHDIYQPIRFAYDYMDSFLGHTIQCKNTVNTLTQSANNEDHEEQLGPDEDQGEQISQADNQNQRVNTNTLSVSTIRRRKHPIELSEAGIVMKEAISTFNAVVKRNESQSIPKEDDDWDLYAKLLANKLRKLSQDKRLRLMHAIDGMFLTSQYTIDSESSSSSIPTLSPEPQHGNQSTGSRNLSYDRYQPRSGTSLSSHSEPIMRPSPTPSPQPQNTNQSTRSRNLSYNQYQPRTTAATSAHSKPIMHHSPLQTPSSQPQHDKAFHFSPRDIQDSNTHNTHNRYQGSNVIQSNDVLHLSVIHIPEQNTSAETIYNLTTDEETVIATNIIQEAFLKF